jgi:cyanophycin synthetase
VAGVLDALAFSSPAEAIERAVQAVRSAEPGEPPSTIVPKIPIVAVTGTNGKTTTSRMIAHIARERGLVVGWSSTDGIYVDGELIEEGDYSGPSGAGRVLARPEVELAVTETARGGILLKGIGVTRNDVSVVTNVTADHLGLQGIDTLDQLAEVKSVVARITRKDGWAVLNADDPRVIAMAGQVRAQHWVFSREPEAPGVREALSGGGRATTVIDGWVCVLSPGRDPEPVIELAHVPMTLSGLSRFNVENALAATSAALAIGIDLETVRRGLATFHPDPEHNPGRMNLFSLRGVTVVLDLAHNEAGLQAMIEIMNGVRHPGARLLLALGAVGDRQDELLELLGELAARDCDEVVIAHKERYLRGRSRDDLEQLLRRGAERVGGVVGEVFDTEVEALASLVQRGQPGDVVGLMCHAERHEAYAWLSEQGASVDDPTTLTAKVRAANSRDLPPASPN